MVAKRRIIPVFIPHLGCPHCCVFCDQNAIAGQKMPVAPEQVVKEIEHAKEIFGDSKAVKTQLAFYGGSFTAVEEEYQNSLLQAVQPYIADGTVDDIRVSTRPDCIDKNILERLKKYGVSTIELGCQSLDENVLAVTERGHTAKDCEDASRLIKQYGFELILQMMTGLPGSSDELDIATAKKLIALSPNGVRIYPTVVLAGTKLESMWKAGQYTPPEIENTAELCGKLTDMFWTANITIVRLGLNPSDDLSGGQAVAGAYHPALGEICMGRAYCLRAAKQLEALRGSEAVCLRIPKGRTSMVTGKGRANIERMRAMFNIKKIILKEAEDLTEGQIFAEKVMS